MAARTTTVLLILLVTTDALAASRLRVRGSAHIDGHAGRAQGHLLVTGSVLDDAAQPIPTTLVSVVTLPSLAPAMACGSASPARMTTDEGGRFCVWFEAPIGVYGVHVEVPATEWIAPANAAYDVDLTKRSIELRFDPEPRVVALDSPTETTLDAVATLDEEAEGAPHLPLELANETGDVVARAITDASGRATFPIDAQKLGPPGPGTLRVHFAGSGDTMASDHTTPIERDVRVSLAAQGDLEPASPEDGVPIHIRAKAMSGSPTGTVEARVDGVIVGAAQLDHGEANLVATFSWSGSDARGAQAPVQLHYVPDRPWFQSGSDSTVLVPIRGPSPWRQAPLAIGAVCLAAWLLIGRNARRQRLDRTLVMQRPPTHEGHAGISVVQSSRSRVGKLVGRVVDAHDGWPIADACLAIVVPSFDGSSVATSTTSDDHGAFELEVESSMGSAELLVEAPLHTELRRKLPGAGVLEIALVSRRRALLDRLVQWARRRGPPFDQRPEPTPAQVRRAAQHALPEAAVWADAVERAAFDQQDVDAQVEQKVMALDPDKPRRV